MTEVFHYTSQLQPFPHDQTVVDWEKRSCLLPCPSDCSGCLLSGQRAQSPPADCLIPQPQRHTLGWPTRGLPHFNKRDHNPLARKIRELPVTCGPTEDSEWCVCVGVYVYAVIKRNWVFLTGFWAGIREVVHSDTTQKKITSFFASLFKNICMCTSNFTFSHKPLPRIWMDGYKLELERSFNVSQLGLVYRKHF